MAVYTKGPWELESYSLRGESYTAISGEGWDELATVVTRMKGDAKDSPEGVANARLIAAAPDMLAALTEAADALTDSDAYPLTLKRVHDAIAKAKGKA